LSQQVFLNGTTEGGYSGTPLIEIDGSASGAGALGLDVLAGASGSQVTGLEVTNFDGGGVLLDGASNVTLSGDYVGVHTLAVNGSLRYPVGHGNGVFGVELIHGSNFNTLSNDVISSNRYNGVVISTGSSYNTVVNSKIGTDTTGALQK